jgi:hypothetical protein
MRRLLALVVPSAVLVSCSIPCHAATLDLQSAKISGTSAVACATVQADGIRFDLDMGARRSNWNNARWIVFEFANPLDLSASRALKLAVTTDKPRIDAGVYVALREADGSWYGHPWASDLTQPENAGVALFRDFNLCEWWAPPGGSHCDENIALDPGAISAVAVGCVNPMGIGALSFTLKSLADVAVEEPPTAKVAVSVGKNMLAVNGRDTIPAGVFGAFAIGYSKTPFSPREFRLALVRNLNSLGAADPVSHIQLGCHGERTSTSPRLKKDWEASMTAAPKGWVDQAKASNQRLYVEFWNEPYLNWANKNRINFNPDFYDKTRVAEGGPVYLPGEDEPLPYLKWTKDYDVPMFKWLSRAQWRRSMDSKGVMHPAPHAEPTQWNKGGQAIWKKGPFPPEDVKDGETFTVKVGTNDVTYTAVTPWHVYDETQHAYWSAKGMLKLYCDPALAYGKALKAAEPGAMYFVGWGFRPSEDNWAGWDLVYRDTVDRLIEVADGVHEHDYGGDPLNLPANYEVVQAYSVTKHGKRLQMLNTEQGATVDPQAYTGAVGGVEAASDMVRYRWLARKTLHALSACPDKVFGFCQFGGFMSIHAEGVLWKHLINLRGKLVSATCSDPGVFVVACVDGTDPQNPRPDYLPQRKELVVAVWNDNIAPREVELSIAAPAGLAFDGEGIARRVEVETGSTTNHLRIVETPVPKADGVLTRTEKVDPRSLVVITMPVTGDPTAPQVQRIQHFGKTVVAQVTADKSVSETIDIPADVLKKTKRAWLQFVAQRLGAGEGTATINGKTLPLPSAVTPENNAWIRVLPVDVADLKASNQLQFGVATKANAGYVLAMNSIVVEME